MKNPKFKFSDLQKIIEISGELITSEKINEESVDKLREERREDIDDLCDRHDEKVIVYCIELIFKISRRHNVSELENCTSEDFLDELVDIVSDVNMTFYNDEELEENKNNETLDTVE